MSIIVAARQRKNLATSGRWLSPARASLIAPQIAVPNAGPTAQSWCTVTQFLLQPFISLL